MKFIHIALSTGAMVMALGLASCNSPKAVEQDGSDLWFANSKPYEEVLSSVETAIDPSLGKEAYRITIKDGKRTVAGGSEAGIRYGVYALQRNEALGMEGENIEIMSQPRYEYRILDHWDNLDDSVERGYAGQSMWEWTAPEIPEARIRKYGELCASVGINGSVLNNVNSNPLMLDAEHIARVAAIADILREYGIRTYIAIKWTSPIVLDGIKTGDPLDPSLRQWWKDKADEIYAAIPDFGGFLVKANSEGQEGPQDHGRTHADGANMLAEALQPHGGIVMWRAFVYDPSSDDRARQAVEEFQPLDGQFMDNVIIQIKNGPIDFQPREPFNPLFGQLYKTKMMMEFQITQEYLGFSNHLVYHGTTYEECLDSDTYRDGEGTTVADVITGIAGVANTGQDANFSGYIFAQSNWYMFGRLAWDPNLSADAIAYEWIHQTFIQPEGMSDKAYQKKFVRPVHEILMTSRETTVNYEMPLGLHHIFGGSHYGPGPWESSYRKDWSPTFYHKAGEDGIGFDRTREGTDNVDQYHEPLASKFNDLETCPEELLLWFHHLPWDYQLSSGKTLWDEICLHYDTGISQVEEYRKTWESLKPYVSESIFNEVTKKLDIQKNDAEWWRDACVGYFQTFSKRDLPAGVRPLNMPIDSVMIKSVQSDRAGMPVHDENNKPILLTNRRFRPGGAMSSGGPVAR
ncbi:MAG: alpha-glucuronidase [Bacteroidia bacterium]|nr:alpha-glucuronidase [Bacteroidia bacterium]